MAKINCTVSSCIYWGEGSVCKADEIWVKDKRTASTSDISYMTEISGDLGTMDRNAKTNSQTTAKTSRETCCETMRLREDVEKKGRC